MQLIPLTIKGISYSQTQNGAYALILNELDGPRKLPIVIGAFEAQSIAIALEKDIQPPRPLTHDLFKNTAERFGIHLSKVIIHQLNDGVFYSSMIVRQDDLEEVIDARTSDAIALALRFKAPIFTYEHILEQAGVVLQIEEETKFSVKNPTDHNPHQESQEPYTDYSSMDLDALESALELAVQQENYEQAARIRDEISKRN
jgi:bifunctional DNase/RNase